MNPEFISLLEAAAYERKGRLVGREIKFLCPVHDDHNPSASWNPEKQVWYCHACGAGGGAYDLAKLLGVELPAASPSGLTLDELADYVGLPTDFLRSLGVSPGIHGIERRRCVDIAYTDEKGEEGAVRKRLSLSGEPRMLWRRGDHVLPYGLARLQEARQAGELVLVEGESDSWTAWYTGIPALGLPGASTWQDAWADYLDGIEKVYVWREPDQGGDGMARKIRLTDLPNVYILTPPPGIKDLNGQWHACEHDQGKFRERVRELQATARPASQVRAEALSAEARKLRESAGGLLMDTNLFGLIEEAIRAGGYVGDTNPPMMAYIAITSRHLDRPLNLHVMGPSSAGKNAAVDAAIALMPPEAYHLEKAGSARALIYSEESFEHRTVILAEADSLPQDEGSAASAIRSLAEDSEMTYDVVEKDPQTGESKTRRITKKGPTGLITTSTKRLGEQMSTRTLDTTISDSPQQTRAILRSHAAGVNGGRSEVDVSRFIDLQRWLALAGDHVVVIPFAGALAELVPVDHVRMRRDFRQLQTAIQAVAFLYQCQRDRDEAGQIIATLADYAICRSRVLDSFDVAATGGVTKETRETVEKLMELHTKTRAPVTRTALADAMGLGTKTVWERVERALAQGYVVNEETRPRLPAKLIPGEPLPGDRSALPTVEEVSGYWGREPDVEAGGHEDEADAHARTIQDPSDVCVPPAESHFHASTRAQALSDLDSECGPDGVEMGVEAAISTPVSTLDEAVVESSNAESSVTWKRGNENPEDLRTSTDTCKWIVEEVDGRLHRCGKPALSGGAVPVCREHYVSPADYLAHRGDPGGKPEEVSAI